MLPNCQLHAVAAMSRNRAIGKDGALPWRLPEDLKFFKQLTTGHAIIMGRKTWDSLGRPLPNRRNLVLSRSMTEATGAEILRGVGELEKLELSGDVYVIGGAEIYQLLLPHLTSVYLTRLHREAAGDAFMPEFESDFPRLETLESSSEADWLRYHRA